MIRFVSLDFETGKITAWARVPGGPAHRLAVLGPYDRAAMRDFLFDREQLEQFRSDPGGFIKSQSEALVQRWPKERATTDGPAAA